ncbi:cell division protein ZipA [Saccharospirillum sp. MSK14-1]|uniref:cell division protein ZipA n=1 Tax=Saccharospirillum sp. MSK14-1 TaxID=1897632 RepID=UPI000D35B81A|nr:cell division protein ZipA [Saccharospirillum sp. MSK14-1]PTY36420.1 cell division protein ZipA [Saccharospirillum sp. MSK14-1]
MRELLVIIGVVLIALILWDGMRRMQKKGRYSDDYEDPEEQRKKAEIARELPNGGARTRPMDDRDKTDLNTRLNLRERVPMLMDPVDEEPVEAEDEAVAHVDQHSLDFDAPIGDLSESEALRYSAKPLADAEASDVEPTDAGEADETDADAYDLVPEFDESVGQSDEPVADDQASDEVLDEHSDEPAWAADEPVEFQASASDVQVDDRPVEELVIVHIMAPDGGQLAGSELLELLLRAGLRFGPMDIFHYRNSKGQLEFSLANCVQPGTLDPDGMAEMTTPGVTLFMQLPQRADLLTSFDHMVEMGQFLAQHLKAEMLDENHSTVTPQRVEHYRERLRNFARSQLIQAHE